MSAELQWPNPAQRVTFNVAGMTFEVTARVLDRYPKTLLGCPLRLQQFWDPTREEYFLDRHRPSAEAIVDFYRTGRLRRPEEVPIEVFTDEIRFYQLGDDVMRRFRASEGFQRRKVRVLPQKKHLAPVWLMFEYPDSSIWAAMLAFVSVSFILLSIASICTESFPQFRLMKTTKADQLDRSNLSGHLAKRTLPGKLVGTLCAFAGMLAIALPVPIIVSNFELLYNIQPDDEDLYGSEEEVEPDVVSSTSDGGYQSGSLCTEQLESPKRVVPCSNHSEADDISVIRSEEEQQIGRLQFETVI
ncbi:potassium voltage-gated channel subfamily A member 5-like [Branchiostoma floridae]|uniref:Potassium voltage-gated channel subfamily A member 5-like n=1 Tax=Branchiostoma floridae TaxID=7739 RepID=A0A9J7MD67_BRAFL|nr:potassium voltage-gated channel subfamily A member 5-like [Branchiostoma floridae]